VYEKGNNFGVGAFGRYYFLEVGSRFKTYAELGAGYNQIIGKVATLGWVLERYL